MNIEWMFDLPTDEKSRDDQYESPFYFDGDNLYFISGGKTPILHILDMKTGAETFQYACSGHTVIPEKYFFEKHQDKLIIYTGELWFYEKEQLTTFIQISIDAEITSHVLKDHLFIFADKSHLTCLNLDSHNIEWKLNISNKKPYLAGEVSWFEEDIACYGNDQLLIVDIVSGEIKNQIKIPRIDKLFMPIKLDDSRLLIGFTNWSNAGILTYDTTDQKIPWKSKCSFEGPLLRCKLYRNDNLVYWVKNDTELICLDTDTGDERYRVRTSPWIYTDPLFQNGSLLYGTAGRDGYFVNLDAQSGNEKWSFFLKNGCAYFDFYDKTVVLGDFEKTIYRIDVSSGNVINKLSVDGNVVGRITVHENAIYTVIWGNENTPIRLIKIKI